MEKVDFKRAKFSGFLDVLGFLAALVMTAGYIVVDLVKVSGLPDGITNFWGKLSDGVEKAGWTDFLNIRDSRSPSCSEYWRFCF